MRSSERRHSRAARLLAPIIVLLVTVLLCEALLRAWYNLFPPLNHNLLPPSKAGLHLFEPRVGNAFYAVRPHHEQTFLRHEFRVSVRTNNLGLREARDYGGEHVDIGFIGDSFTFGWGVEADERWSAIVQDAFPALNVLSYAYPNGHAPVNYLAWLQHNPEMLPDILVLGLFAFNDLAEDTADAVIEERDGVIASVGSRSLEVDRNGFVVGQGEQPPMFPSLAWWKRYTALGRTFVVARQRVVHGEGEMPRADELRPLDAGVLDDSARLALDHVRRIDALAREAGAVLLVFYIPFPSYIDETPVCPYTQPLCAAQREGNAPGEALAEWAHGENIAFIDPVAHFRGLSAQGIQLYYTWDAHWTPAGHAAAGELVADYIRRRGLLQL